MKERQKDRLGALTYGVLVFGILNGQLQSNLSRETLHNLPVLIPLGAFNTIAVLSGLGVWCYYVYHLFALNERVGWAAKLLWLFFLTFGNLLVMPVYWYLYVVSEARAIVLARQAEPPTLLRELR